MSRRDDYIPRVPNWLRLHDGPMPVRTHTGVGDTIIQAGLMIELSRKYGRIAIPCYRKCLNLGISLYGCFPDIQLYIIPDEHEGHLCSPTDRVFDEVYRENNLDREQEMRIGEYAGEGLWNDFIKAFYVRSGVEYRHRWDSFPEIRLPQQAEWPDNHRVFVHDDTSRGHVITRADGFRPGWTQSILQYAQILHTADEIHCIDSSFFCLANQLPTTGKLFYHHYARPDRPVGFRYELRKDWTYLY
jgi:hypothetical protein